MRPQRSVFVPSPASTLADRQGAPSGRLCGFWGGVLQGLVGSGFERVLFGSGFEAPKVCCAIRKRSIGFGEVRVQ
jgi:hypothetical protein